MSPDSALPPRDAHLHQALRHAPDAQLQPPPALDAAILSAARQAVTAPGSWHGTGRMLVRAWHSLGQPRHAAALATALVASLVTVLWRADPPEEALAPSSPQQAAPALRGEPATTGDLRDRAPHEGASGLSSPVAAGDQPPAAAGPAPAREPSGSKPAVARRERADTAAAKRPERQQAQPAGGKQPTLEPSVDRPGPVPAPTAAGRAQTTKVERAAGGHAPAAALAAAPASPSAPTEAVADPLAAAIARLHEASAPAERIAAWTGWQARAGASWQALPPAAVTDMRVGEPLRAPDGAELGRVWFETGAVVWQPAGRPGLWRLAMSAEELDALRAALGPPAR